MQALVYEGPERMPVRDVDRPRATRGTVIVRVKAVGICGSDVHGFLGTTGRRTPPIIMGHEFCGVVDEVGEEVAAVKAGDRVVVQPLMVCGTCENCTAGLPNICLNRRVLGVHRDGAYAEAVQVPQQMLYPLPETLSWEQGAMVEPLAVALHAVNLTPLQLMDSVAIIGAGTIGLLTLLAARLKGAGRIFISDRNHHRLEMARRLGADVAINVDDESPVERIRQETRGRGVPAVIEAVGLTATVQQSLALVGTGGHVTWIGNSQPDVELSMQQVVTRELTVRGAYGFSQEFPRAIDLLRTRRLDVTPLIERSLPLEEGPRIVSDLAAAREDAVKVILRP